MLSACIPHRLNGHIEENFKLGRCVSSLCGYDELLIVANTMGIPRAFNACLYAASGDYIVLIADDCRLVEGTLADLPDERGVTVPLVDGRPVWNPVYCFPSWVIRRVGYFDVRFSPAYFEDDDMLERLAVAGIPVIVKRSVNFSHPRPGSTITPLYAESEYAVHASAEYERSHAAFVEKWGHEPVERPILEDEKSENESSEHLLPKSTTEAP